MSNNNLPEIFETFADARKKGFLTMKAEKDKGRNVVGIFCTYTPREIIYAADALSVSLCSTSEETIPEAEKRLPKNLCPLIKSSYGFAITDKCPYMYFSDLIVGETTCDGKKKMYELLGEVKDTHVMQLPHTRNSYSFELWKNEIKELIKKLEEKFNVEITEEKLKDAIKLCNEERNVMKEFFSLAKLVPSPVKGTEMHDVMNSSNFKFDKKEFFEEIRKTTQNMKERYDKGETPFTKDTPRILITGCPTGGVVDKVIKQIEEIGGSVVCIENCVGTKNFEMLVDEENKDPIEAIAERYINIPCSIMTPNDGRMERIKQYIEDYKVDGVVDVTLTACHTYAIETEKVRRTVEGLGKSYLAIETNYSNSDAPQLRTRLEAFVEML
ncbi:double-cubane-cluster-containing anaerobic reductase [Brachyspira innocens]|uniref:Double-cubane-cluster-containing anaerobic reductase n=1 Tax=Brachyspira innocens TaxID=13264 RepID=A0ABT8YXD7_9SPIR|nr:double-cubane-cluster-containing anaerobic reductase [Brachyspira innocens]MDO6993730.1 double-cubane-cluster-containing anaerobic reductase [Brachyspira innocens]MDO7020514.1 double-cubane-cluster-containing anaerobic reductase [Brachyspira innocens]